MNWIIKYISIIVLAIITFIFTIQSFLSGDVYLAVEYIEQYRLHIAIGCLIFAFWKRGFPLFLYLSLICINFFLVFQNTFQEVSCQNKTSNLKVMTYNTFKDNKKQFKIDNFVKMHDPDMIWFQELKINAYHKIYDQLKNKYPYAYPTPSKTLRQGKVFISKYPFKVINQTSNVNSKFTHIKLNIAKKSIDFFGVHFKSPKLYPDVIQRNSQIIELFSYMLKQEKMDRFVIMGDMNNVFWSPQFQLFYKYLNVHIYNNLFNFNPTWPSYVPSFLQVPIDNIMVSQNVCFESFQKEDSFGSDHHPLKANIWF